MQRLPLDSWPLRALAPLQTLPHLYDQLAAHGMDPSTPAVAVERGTTRRQRVVWGPVSELPQRAQSAGLKSPTLIIIGAVVALAPGWLQWQAAGRPVVVPRALPPHGYTLPAIDAAALLAAAAGATSPAWPSSGRGVGAGDGGIRTREVLPAAAPVAVGAARSATVMSAQPATQPAPAQQPVIPAAAPAEQGPGEAEAGCGGEDEACPLPLPPARRPAPQTQQRPAAPGCGDEDSACALPLRS
jgi:hypothetical protein